ARRRPRRPSASAGGTETFRQRVKFPIDKKWGAERPLRPTDSALSPSGGSGSVFLSCDTMNGDGCTAQDPSHPGRAAARCRAGPSVGGAARRPTPRGIPQGLEEPDYRQQNGGLVVAMGRLYGILWVTAALLAGFLVMAAPGRAANGAGSPMDGTAPAPATLENGFEVPAGPLPGARHSDGPGEPEGAPAPPRTGTAPPERVEGVVYIIPIEGTIDEGLAVFVRRALREAREAGAVAVLVEINTFGGRVDSATDIKDAL